MRGFVFQNTLPSIKTDEILELQTRIQPLPSRGAQDQTYLVGIESVRDGQWTIHCEGTAVSGSRSDQTGSTTRTSGHNSDIVIQKHDRTATLNRITREDSDQYQLHPLTIYGCLQHALEYAAPDNHSNNGGDSKLGSTVGLMVSEIEEFKVWGGRGRTPGNWTVHSASREETLVGHVACVDVDLEDEAGDIASTLRGLRATTCEETHEAFGADVPPPERNARVPAFLRPLLG